MMKLERVQLSKRIYQLFNFEREEGEELLLPAHIIEEFKSCHEEFLRDGFVYFNCPSDHQEIISEMKRLMEIFFALPPERKKGFASIDILEKRKAKQQEKEKEKEKEKEGIAEEKQTVLVDDPYYENGEEYEKIYSLEEAQQVGDDSNDLEEEDPSEGINNGVDCTNCGSFWNPFTSRGSPRHQKVQLTNKEEKSDEKTITPIMISPNQDLSTLLAPAIASPQLLPPPTPAAAAVVLKNSATGKGYVSKDVNPREFYDVSEGDHFYHKEFDKISKKTFSLFQKTCQNIFKEILYPLKIKNQDYLESLLTGSSHSKLRLIRYYFNGEKSKETCNRHTDMGFLTLLPAFSTGLEGKLFEFPYPFLDIEALAPEKPCYIIFAGEALSRLTGGYFHSLIHRVTSKDIRYSMPFFFRPNSSKLLDMKLLESDPLNRLLEEGKVESLPEVTADNLEIMTQQQYKTKTIPLELGNYKQSLYYRQLFESNQ